MHKGTPMVLRVVMRVPFDPTSTDAQSQTKIEERLNRTQELAARQIALDEYQVLEIHLYQEEKEHELRQKAFVRQLP
jgi:hypothetical protein